MRKANGTGGCYGRKYSGLSELIPFKMGLQIPCGIYPKEEAEGPVWAGSAPTEGDLSCLGTAERVPDSGRSSHGWPYSYVNCDSTKVCSCFCHWFFEGEERDFRSKGSLRQGEELHRRASLGSGIRSIDGWIWIGTSSPIHPRPGGSGWDRGAVLNLAPEARFSATFSHWVDRLWGGPTHQATRSAGGVWLINFKRLSWVYFSIFLSQKSIISYKRF